MSRRTYCVRVDAIVFLLSKLILQEIKLTLRYDNRSRFLFRDKIKTFHVVDAEYGGC